LPAIRVLTAELPGILNDIIGSVLQAAGDIEVVGRAASYPELVALARRLHPNVVIMELDESGPPGLGWDLYLNDPLLRVLGVVDEGRQTFVYELRPHRTALGELSPEALVAAVRRISGGQPSLSVGGNSS
jgi:DNA-binding NarL/FixJ family response regulator